jgi:hypothetical protein
MLSLVARILPAEPNRYPALTTLDILISVLGGPAERVGGPTPNDTASELEKSSSRDAHLG